MKDITFTNGPFNYAAVFDTNNYITIDRVIQNDFTISFWMKTIQETNDAIQWHLGISLIDAEVCGDVEDFGISLVNNRIAFGMGKPDKTIKSTTVVNDNQFYHIVASYSNNMMKLYINGTLESEIEKNPITIISPWIGIGKNPCKNNALFKGSIDELRIYNRGLTETEVSDIYKKTN